MTFDEVLSLFDGVSSPHQVAGGRRGYYATCPRCMKKHKLGISEGAKGTLLYCFHCEQESPSAVEEICMRVGITANDLFYEPPMKPRSYFDFEPVNLGTGHAYPKKSEQPVHKKPEAKEPRGARKLERFHVYCAADGAKVAKKEIYRYENGDKTALWFRYDPEHGKFSSKPGLFGITVPLYRSERLAQTNKRSIVVVEGEKDADTVWKISGQKIPATSLPNGAGQTKWLPEYSVPFIGKNVVILHDNDVPGEGYAEMVARNLQGVAAKIKVINAGSLAFALLNDQNGADITDVVNEIGEQRAWDELLYAVKHAPEYFEFCPGYEEAQEGGEQ